MLKFCKKPNGSEIQGLDWPIQISFQQPLSIILTQKFSSMLMLKQIFQ